MDLYSNSTVTTSTTSGLSLAYRLRGLGTAGRAFVAAELHLGHLVVEAPTIGQSAALARCSAYYVRAALRTDPALRDAIESGLGSLIQPDMKVLERAVRHCGVDAAWNVIVAQLG